MQYYFAGWENDSEDIFALMESWWQDIREGQVDIDHNGFKVLHESGKLLCICSRDDSHKLVACFVGIIVPDLYHKGKTRLEQLAACFSKEKRTASNYFNMLKQVEAICAKLKINSVSFGVVREDLHSIMKKKGYSVDVFSMTKEIG